MLPIDKKIDQDIKEGRIGDSIENLPAEYEEEDEQLENRKPDLGEIDEDPSEL
ncbi:MAG: hypothetical protein JOZ32_09860 [Bryobacterales bacterium]|nr:hypothetical protein [Bryobacterales bacterium]